LGRAEKAMWKGKKKKGGVKTLTNENRDEKISGKSQSSSSEKTTKR